VTIKPRLGHSNSFYSNGLGRLPQLRSIASMYRFLITRIVAGEQPDLPMMRHFILRVCVLLLDFFAFLLADPIKTTLELSLLIGHEYRNRFL
jgi:hypothetical protein